MIDHENLHRKAVFVTDSAPLIIFRIHKSFRQYNSYLGYLPPEEFENRLIVKEQNFAAQPGYSNLSVQG